MIKELTAIDTSSYKNFLRMDSSTFEELLGMVAPLISKQDTLMRKPIPAGDLHSEEVRQDHMCNLISDTWAIFPL